MSSIYKNNTGLVRSSVLSSVRFLTMLVLRSLIKHGINLYVVEKVLISLLLIFPYFILNLIFFYYYIFYYILALLNLMTCFHFFHFLCILMNDDDLLDDIYCFFSVLFITMT